MVRTIQAVLCAGALMLGSGALAQTQGQAGGQRQGMAGGQAKGGKTFEYNGFTVPTDEKAFLERLHRANQMEIQLGQLAQQKAQHPEVKSFGQMMVQDHTRADQQLMSYASGRKFKLSDKPSPLNDMEKRVMDAHDATLRELQALSGAPFDSTYMANMVGAHDMDLGKVMAGQQVFNQGEVASLLQQLSQTFQNHRQQAYRTLGQLSPAEARGVGGAGQGMGGAGQRQPMGGGMGGTGGGMGGRDGGMGGRDAGMH